MHAGHNIHSLHDIAHHESTATPKTSTLTRIPLPKELSDVWGHSFGVLQGNDLNPNPVSVLLLEVLYCAAPSLRNRKQCVQDVAEFYPSNGNLHGYNMNHGYEMRIRLRHAGNKTSVLPFESVLHTVMHEICHNIHANHSAEFYDLLNELMNEAESVVFRRKHGIGESHDGRFWGMGIKLGGTGKREEEKRWRGPIRRPGSGDGIGHRVGGIHRSSLSKREQMIAAMERRGLIDDECCITSITRSSSSSSSSIVQHHHHASMDLSSIAIPNNDKKQPPCPTLHDGRWCCSVCTLINSPVVLACVTCATEKNSKATSCSAPDNDDDGRWECWNCPVINHNPLALACLVCGAERHGTTTTPNNQWTCSTCTFMNEAIVLVCKACGIERNDNNVIVIDDD